MSELPSTWEQTKLTELATLKTGPFGSALGKKNYITGGTPVINPMHISAGRINPTAEMSISNETAERLSDFLLSAGDVIVGRRGEMGRCAVIQAEQDGWLCGTGSLIVRPNGAVRSAYLQRLLSSPAVVQTLESASVGSTMVNLNQRIMLDLDVPVPPFEEQQRIADKLDAVLARVDACRERLDRVPGILKRFRQAVLAAATFGKLTEEWRSSHARFLSSGWEETTIGSLLESGPRNGYSPRAVEYQTSVKTLTLTATTTGRFLPQHFKYIDECIPQDSYLWLQPNDILIQRANTIEYVGVSAVYDGPPNGFIYPDLMMKCRGNERVQTQFLHYLLLSDQVRRHFREHATGTAGNMPKINQRTVLTAPAVLPPLDEQTEIIRRAEILLTYADRLETRYATARTQVERLTPSLLAKAFRGELVPQDPNDEPASVLLERIRTARAAAPAKPKRRRSGLPAPDK